VLDGASRDGESGEAKLRERGAHFNGNVSPGGFVSWLMSTLMVERQIDHQQPASCK
jgi:hypothetical protein